jgi:hypothetical protein
MYRRSLHPSPEKRPPELPEPEECQGCGESPPETETQETHRDRSGAIKGDLLCVECGNTLREGVFLKEPDRW